MLRRSWLVAVLAALPIVLGVPSSAGAAPAQVPWAGVMVDGPVTASVEDYSTQWSDMRAAHLGNARLAFYWPDVEPSKGQFTFAATDAVVTKAAQNGLQVLPVVLRTPGWAARNPRQAGSPPKSGSLIKPLMGQLIARYGPQGSFWAEHPELARKPLRDWQIYNEPELRPYWNERDWATGYVKLLKAADQAIKAADPGARTILAGLTNQSWKDLAKIYEAGGRSAFDVAALHIYTSNAKGVAKVTGYARKVMRRNHDARKKIWLTEVTWPASRGKRPGTRPWETTEKGQAARVKQGIPYLARVRKKLGIDKVVWYAWLTVEDRQTWQTYSGLRRLRNDKVVDVPAYSRFVAALGRLAG